MQIEKLEVVCKAGGVDKSSTIDIPVFEKLSEIKNSIGEDQGLAYLNAGARSALRSAEYSRLSPGSRKAEINRELAGLLSKFAHGDKSVVARVKELTIELDAMPKGPKKG